VPGTLIARELHKAHGAATILAGVSVTVAPGDVLGVVGANGAGKSTLLRLLAGLDRPDRGVVQLTAGTAGYLPQEPDRAAGERLQDFLSRRTGVAGADARFQAATHAMAAGASRGRSALRRRLRVVACARRCRPRAPCGVVLRDLGLDPGLLDLATAALSGGQAARASLAAILLSRFDVLLLDEPTNDLDFDGLARLERFVAERPGGAVIVSHDRAFLERTVSRVLELDEISRTAAEYGGGWAGYLELRATAARHAEDRYETFTAERDRLTDRAGRQRQWSETGVRRAKASAASDPDKIGRAKRAERSEKQAAKVRATEKAIERSRRWTSRGGAGSSSCASVAAGAPETSPRACTGRCSARELRARPARPRAGLGRAGRAGRPERQREDNARRRTARPAAAGRRHALDRARCAHRRARPGPPRLRRRDRAARRLRGAERAAGAGARSLLAKFGLETTRWGAGRQNLSPGERTRASLALLMASGANWLVLDEPTNHLDLRPSSSSRPRWAPTTARCCSSPTIAICSKPWS
jgi:ATPase subunit of ABC transporter with duplicated ATPase domains